MTPSLNPLKRKISSSSLAKKALLKRKKTARFGDRAALYNLCGMKVLIQNLLYRGVVKAEGFSYGLVDHFAINDVKSFLNFIIFL